MYNAIDVALYVIKRCNEMGRSISNLKLQKILYFLQAEFLVAKNRPCFAENIEAWDFGPVVPEVYHKFKVYGGASIPYIGKETLPLFSEQDQTLMNGIIDKCSAYSASALVEMTHHQTPWKAVYRPYTNAIISNESIQTFFSED